MEYFFVPGRLRKLSWVELNSVCKNVLGFQYNLTEEKEYFVLKTDLKKSFVEKIFSRLGGFLKYGEVLDNNFEIEKLFDNKKIVFGISSYYEKFCFEDIKKLSYNFKSEFIKTGRKVRFVLPKSDNSFYFTSFK